MDVIYRVRVGERNEPLRYSLRSLKNLPHHRVLIAGFKPSWVRDVTYWYRNQEGYTDQENSSLNLKLALQDPDLTPRVIVMDDDFYIMRPVEEVPAMHQGSLQAVINRYKLGGRFHQAYSLIKTQQELRRLGVTGELLSYELHMPMVMEVAKVREMFGIISQPLFAIRPRTLYGNLYNILGEFTADGKDTSDQIITFFSTGDIGLSRDRLAQSFSTRSVHE